LGTFDWTLGYDHIMGVAFILVPWRLRCVLSDWGIVVDLVFIHGLLCGF
jgi:hypothetical protein